MLFILWVAIVTSLVHPTKGLSPQRRPQPKTLHKYQHNSPIVWRNMPNVLPMVSISNWLKFKANFDFLVTLKILWHCAGCVCFLLKFQHFSKDSVFRTLDGLDPVSRLGTYTNCLVCVREMHAMEFQGLSLKRFLRETCTGSSPTVVLTLDSLQSTGRLSLFRGVRSAPLLLELQGFLTQ